MKLKKKILLFISAAFLSFGAIIETAFNNNNQIIETNATWSYYENFWVDSICKFNKQYGAGGPDYFSAHCLYEKRYIDGGMSYNNVFHIYVDPEFASITIPYRKNYTFNGYYTLDGQLFYDSNGITEYTSKENCIEIVNYGAAILFAKWTPTALITDDLELIDTIDLELKNGVITTDSKYIDTINTYSASQSDISVINNDLTFIDDGGFDSSVSNDFKSLADKYLDVCFKMNAVVGDTSFISVGSTNCNVFIEATSNPCFDEIFENFKYNQLSTLIFDSNKFCEVVPNFAVNQFKFTDTNYMLFVAGGSTLKIINSEIEIYGITKKAETLAAEFIEETTGTYTKNNNPDFTIEFDIPEGASLEGTGLYWDNPVFRDCFASGYDYLEQRTDDNGNKIPFSYSNNAYLDPILEIIPGRLYSGNNGIHFENNNITYNYKYLDIANLDFALSKKGQIRAWKISTDLILETSFDEWDQPHLTAQIEYVDGQKLNYSLNSFLDTTKKGETQTVEFEIDSNLPIKSINFIIKSSVSGLNFEQYTIKKISVYGMQLDNIVYDSLKTNTNTTKLTEIWNQFADDYELLSDIEEEKFDKIGTESISILADMIKKYDEIYLNYGSTLELENFLNREVTEPEGLIAEDIATDFNAAMELNCDSNGNTSSTNLDSIETAWSTAAEQYSQLSDEEKAKFNASSGSTSSEITDLTGCTWIGNEGINQKESAKSLTVSLSFTNNGNDYTSIFVGAKPGSYTIKYGDLIVYHNDHYPSAWDDTVYKTIQITGGEDATNLDVIAWLQANGTLTKPTQEIDPEIEEMLSKYDYIYGKYGSTIGKDFLGRFSNYDPAAQGNKSKILNIKDINNSTWIIAVVSIIGLTSVGAYFFYRKRKEE